MKNKYAIKNKHLVLDKEWVKDKIQKNGLNMIETTFTTLKDGFFAFTDDGYIVKVTPNSIYKNQTNPIFSNKNPYTTYNIKRFLFLNNISTMLLSTKYINNTEYLEWECECGNKFKAPWNRFLQGQRLCKKCARRKIFLIDTDKLKSDFAERGYQLITAEAKVKNEKVEYICLKHKDKGVQSISLGKFYNAKQGCKYCGVEKSMANHIINKNECIKLISERKLNYIDSYLNNGRTFIEFTCDKHIDKGVQCCSVQQMRKNICGCKYCNMPKYTNEEKINSLLQSWDVSFERQHSFYKCRDKKPLPFDFYIPEFNVLIEYQGEQHYKAIRRGNMSFDEALNNLKLIQKHDNIKRSYCIKNNINYIEIPYWENEDIENFIFNKLVKFKVIKEIKKSA